MVHKIKFGHEVIKFVASILGLIIYIIGFATPAWIEYSTGFASVTAGLFKICVETNECSTYAQKNELLIAAEVFGCLALVMYVCFTASAAMSFVSYVQKIRRKKFPLVAFISSFSTVLFVSLANLLMLKKKNVSTKLGYSGILAVISLFFALILCVFYFYDVMKSSGKKETMQRKGKERPSSGIMPMAAFAKSPWTDSDISIHDSYDMAKTDTKSKINKGLPVLTVPSIGSKSDGLDLDMSIEELSDYDDDIQSDVNDNGIFTIPPPMLLPFNPNPIIYQEPTMDFDDFELVNAANDFGVVFKPPSSHILPKSHDSETTTTEIVRLEREHSDFASELFSRSETTVSDRIPKNERNVSAVDLEDCNLFNISDDTNHLICKPPTLPMMPKTVEASQIREHETITQMAQSQQQKSYSISSKEGVDDYENSHLNKKPDIDKDSPFGKGPTNVIQFSNTGEKICKCDSESVDFSNRTMSNFDDENERIPMNSEYHTKKILLEKEHSDSESFATAGDKASEVSEVDMQDCDLFNITNYSDHFTPKTPTLTMVSRKADSMRLKGHATTSPIAPFQPQQSDTVFSDEEVFEF